MPISDLTTPHRLVAALGREFKGEVVDPGHPDYGQARRVWNADVDRLPALVVRPADSASVGVAVRLAQAEGLLLAVRGGGHGVAGTGTCDNGLVIDLSLMRDVRIDLKRGVLRAQGGAIWGDVDRIAGTRQLATTGALVSQVGAAGYALAGGLGWLMRAHGLSCDNMRSAELVTAAGRSVTLDYYRHAELFWALRGGGGNFGVVTEVAFQPYEVTSVFAGFLIYRIERAVEALTLYEEYCHSAPDSVSTLVMLAHAPVEQFIPEELRGRPVLMIGTFVLAKPGEAERIVAPLRDLVEPDADLLNHMSYRRAQSLYDGCAARDTSSYSKSGFVSDLPTWLIELFVRHAAEMPPGAAIMLQHMGGAVARVDQDATAFAHRHASHFVNVVAGWRAPEERDQSVDVVRRLWGDVAPFTSGAYAGCLAVDDDQRVRSAYSSETWQRLAEVKRTWDPDNLFRMNANIPPADDSTVDRGQPKRRYPHRVPPPRAIRPDSAG